MGLYLTAILPPDELSQQIDDIRIELSEKHKIFAALKPPVHITLYRPLSIEEELEDRLVKLLSPIGRLHSPFKQDLQNFGSFNIQTIFINAVKSEELKILQRDISAMFSKNKIDRKQNSGNTSFHPHITVGYRDIPPAVFPEIWNELKNRRFKRSFMVDQFSLLKHDGQKWQKFKEFKLEKQTDLQLF